MTDEYLTIQDFDVKGKTVLVRVDINCPTNPETKEVTNDARIKLHAATTIKELKERGAKVVVLSHQGRPGDAEFIPLHQHAELLHKYLGNGTEYVDDIFGSNAKAKIKAMSEGDVLVLENVRFYSEELIERPSDTQAKSMLVQQLAPEVDYFVNDAFATIHRSHPSLVGFTEVLPSAAGRVIEKELNALNNVLYEAHSPVVFVLGGVKVKESLKVVRKLMQNNKADTILTGGLFGNLMLAAKGYDIGKISWEVLKGKGIDLLLPQAQEIVRKYGHQIETPVDIAVNNQGRKEISVSDLPTTFMISDVGRETIGRYCKILEDANTIVMNSPMGRFELDEFVYGTEKLIRKAAECDAYSIIGGGHSAKMVSEMGIADKFNHVSVGGRATLYHLSGENTPVVSALKKAKLQWNNGSR